MKHSKNVIYLLLADLIWGAAFVAQRTGGDVLGAYTFTCLRSFIGCIALFPIIAYRAEKNDRDAQKDEGTLQIERKQLLTGGLICGLALAAATNFQQLGITMGASVGKAGFLTACYILMVPIFGLFLKKPCHWNVALGVGLALAGLYCLCMTEARFVLTRPDILLLFCAVMFAVQILAIDHFAPKVDVVKLSWYEFLVCGIITSFPMWFVDMGHSIDGAILWCQAFTSLDAWIPLLYAGVCSSGIAYTLQIAGQKNFNPTIAALLMSFESVFSLFFGWALLGEALSVRELIGCALIFAAVMLAQAGPMKRG